MKRATKEPTAAELAQRIIADVAEFERECNAAERTDVDAAWDLLARICGRARRIIALAKKGKP